MKGRAKLLIIWLVLLTLATIIFIGEKKRSTELNTPVVKEEFKLLPLPIEEISAVEVMHKGAMHRFERDAAGVWFYHGMHDASKGEHGHTADAAAADIIDKALTGFGRTRRERKMPLNEKADEYGVTRPDIFIMVYRAKEIEPLARYAVGITATDTYSRYILPVGSADVFTIPEFQIKNLLDLIDAVNKVAPAAAS